MAAHKFKDLLEKFLEKNIKVFQNLMLERHFK